MGLMTEPQRDLVRRATDLLGVSNAFLPAPLIAGEIQYCCEALSRLRSDHLQQNILEDLTLCADQSIPHRIKQAPPTPFSQNRYSIPTSPRTLPC